MSVPQPVVGHFKIILKGLTC